jgi:hypothetical protein
MPTMPLPATKLHMTAREGLAKPIVPGWVYWLMSFLRWCLDARGHDAVKLLMRRPYLAKVS